MSKMSSEFIRRDESQSLDNAEEVRELRAENRRLRLANAELLGSLEGLEKGLSEGGLITAEHLRAILASHGGTPARDFPTDTTPRSER